MLLGQTTQTYSPTKTQRSSQATKKIPTADKSQHKSSSTEKSIEKTHHRISSQGSYSLPNIHEKLKNYTKHFNNDNEGNKPVSSNKQNNPQSSNQERCDFSTQGNITQENTHVTMENTVVCCRRIENTTNTSIYHHNNTKYADEACCHSNNQDIKQCNHNNRKNVHLVSTQTSLQGKSSAKRVSDHNESATTIHRRNKEKSQNKQRLRQLRVTKTMLLVFITYYFAYLPAAISVTLDVLCKVLSTEMANTVNQVTFCVLSTSSLINPWIYFITNSEFRKSVQKLLSWGS